MPEARYRGQGLRPIRWTSAPPSFRCADTRWRSIRCSPCPFPHVTAYRSRVPLNAGLLRAAYRPTPRVLTDRERTRRCRSALLSLERWPLFWRVVRRPSGCARSPTWARSAAPTAPAAERRSLCFPVGQAASVLAPVACARNGTSGIPLTVRHQIKIASTSGLPLDAVGPGPL